MVKQGRAPGIFDRVKRDWGLFVCSLRKKVWPVPTASATAFRVVTSRYLLKFEGEISSK